MPNRSASSLRRPRRVVSSRGGSGCIWTPAAEQKIDWREVAAIVEDAHRHVAPKALVRRTRQPFGSAPTRAINPSVPAAPHERGNTPESVFHELDRLPLLQGTRPRSSSPRTQPHTHLRCRRCRRRDADRTHGDPLQFAEEDRYARVQRHRAHGRRETKRPTHRLSRRGNRAINDALHIVAVTQVRFAHSPGRAFYDCKLARGHTATEAIRALKRRVSNIVYRHVVADAQPASRTRTRRAREVNEETTPQARRARGRIFCIGVDSS